MKQLTPNTSRLASGFLCLLLGLASQARAAIQYWDNNGTGTASSGVWDLTTPNWSSSSTLTATPSVFVPGNLAVFTAGPAAGTITVTVNTPNLSCGGFDNNGVSGNACTLTLSGSGSLSLASGLQGVLVSSGKSTTVNLPINGPGALNPQGSGTLNLYATNGYTGGTTLNNNTTLLQFNNGYAFGYGTISLGYSGAWSPFLSVGGAPLTITNAFKPTVNNAGINFGSAANTPVTCTGNWTLGANTVWIRNNGDSTAPLILSGVLSGSGGVTFSGNNSGLIKLTGANTYTGMTTVSPGNNPITVEIAGSISGDCYVTNSSLKLDSPTALKPTATLKLETGLASGAINLNFTGTQTVKALYFGPNLMTAGTYGAPGSPATFQYPYFSGNNGVINVAAAPAVVTQPESTAVYPQQTVSRTFNTAASGEQSSMSYQWKLNGNNISDNSIFSGTGTTTLTVNPPYTAGTYTCFIQNLAGSTTTQPATLTLLATNDYVNAVLGAPQGPPIAYWRLDETNGTTAYDWVGMHQGTYVNALLNQPGFSVVSNSDTAMFVPADRSNLGRYGLKGTLVVSNAVPDFSFPDPYLFTIECWGMSTNFASGIKQRLLSTLTLSGAGGWGFGFPNNTTLELTAGGVTDWDVTIPQGLAAGVWYHFVATCDGSTYTLYLNGNPLGTKDVTEFMMPASSGELTFGENPLTYPSEQLYGGIDEVAIYNYALDQTTVTNHYLARYTDAPLQVSAPVITPATNYFSLSATLTEAASGAGLSYQWYRGAGTANPVGNNSSTIVLAPLKFSDAGSYHCVVRDAGNHTADTPVTSLTVASIPTSADQLNLTNGLVLHLPFDTDYKDISGRNNNGTAVGTPSLAASGAIGTGSLHYGTSATGTNYVTLGTPADLQFSDSGSFTVSYWVRGTANTGLPFLCDSTNGFSGIVGLNGGFYFGPNTNGTGGWAAALGSAAHQMGIAGATIINDGKWHHLAHVANRAGSMITYLDGALVDSHPISYISDSVDTAWPVNIGQDGTGGLVVSDQSGDIDDMAVWKRTLTAFEVDGIYLAGATNHVSFAPVVITAPPLAATTISSINATTLSYTGGSGTHFVLQGTTNLVAPTWTRLLTNSATPGAFTLPARSSASMFYRVSSEN